LILPANATHKFDEIFRVADAYSMCGFARLSNIYNHASRLADSCPQGHFVDCGVARGGSSAVLARAIKGTGSESWRRVFSFDTFEGLPAPGPKDTHEGVSAELLGWGPGTCAADAASLLEVAEKLKVGHLVIPVKGLFADTLLEWGEKVGKIAFLHIDGDWYDSTYCVLESLYHRVLPGGIIQIDDFGYWQGCQEAVVDFFAERGLGLKYEKIDTTGIWLQKYEGVTH
jgi:O-methyltransferase